MEETKQKLGRILQSLSDIAVEILQGRGDLPEAARIGNATAGRPQRLWGRDGDGDENGDGDGDEGSR